MIINNSSVVIDNDSLCHLADTNLPEDTIVRDVKRLFEGYNSVAIVHPLVYKNEVPPSNHTINRFFDEKIIQAPKIEDVYQSDELKKQYYILTLLDLYRSYFGVELEIPEDEIFLTWKKKCSLGELHSLVMCLVCDCQIFISDDKDSKAIKTLIESKLHTSIKVFDRKEAFNNLPQDEKQKIPSAERKRLSHIRCS